MAMPALRYTSDIDAAQLTLVRSLENLQKALPENRRHSATISTLAFGLNQDLGRSSTVASPDIGTNRRSSELGISAGGFRSFDGAREDDDSYVGGVTSMVGGSSLAGPSWKKYLRPSEVLALERQMESLHQDMRDLEGARRRRYQEYPIRGSSNRQRLRRISEVVPQRRVISFSELQPNSSPEDPAISPSSRISTADEDLELGNRSISGPSNSSQIGPRSNRKPVLHIVKKLPRMQKSVETNHPARPTALPSDGHLSKPAVQSRSSSAPEFMLPLSPPLVNVSPSPNIAQSSQYKNTMAGKKAYSEVAYGGSSIRSDQTRRSSIARKGAGRKPQSIGEKKVRFAENTPGIENSIQAEIFAETISLAHQSSSSSLSSLSSWASSQSVSLATAASPQKENPGLFDTHSLSSSDDEESGATTEIIPKAPSSPPNPVNEREADTHLAMGKPETQSPVAGEREGRNPRKPGGLARFFSRKGKGREFMVPEGNGVREAFEKPNYLGRGLRVAMGEPGTSTTPPTPSNTHRPSTNTPIRSLLRKHSQSLLNKLPWKGNKITSTPEAIPEETAESVCAVCRGTFDANSLIQVSEECLHQYCKGCLKI